MKVVLTGYRGTGKSTVGRALAEHLEVPFLDTDARIEREAGCPIRDIFRLQGEPTFRKYERRVMDTLEKVSGVISAGGGAVLTPSNVEKLRAGGTIFLLTADEQTILQRIRTSARPPLTPLSLEEEVHQLLAVRKPFYLQAADYCIQTGGKTVDQVVQEIGGILADPVRKGAEVPPSLKPFVPEGLSPEGDLPVPDQPVRWCGILGHPVAHSRSPRLFGRLFHRFRLNYRYIALQHETVAPLIRAARETDMRGLAVTLPFKEPVIPCLDEVEETARTIGAVNTIVQCGGILQGYNTDWIGIRVPLSDLTGARAVVVGAGGAAAAATFACQDLGMRVTILNRTEARGARLARRFNVRSGPLSAFGSESADVVINATPVGMRGGEETPVPVERLRAGQTVFDLVYTPPETALLRGARERGCRVVPGTEMFVHQARAQFRLFTGIETPVAMIREMMG